MRQKTFIRGESITLDAANKLRANQPLIPGMFKNGNGVYVRKIGTTAGTEIRMAFCKTAAGSGNTIVCYLDTDATGEEVTVWCTLIDATNLNECFPTLVDGVGMPVFWDYSYSTPCWRSLWWFQGKEECE